MFAILEYAKHGNLLQHLIDIKSLTETTLEHELPMGITLKELVDYAAQVARGMEYLASMKVSRCFVIH